MRITSEGTIHHGGRFTPHSPEELNRRAEGFRQYRRKQIAELRDYIEGESMEDISVSPEDTKAGSPKPGDMIARNPKNYADKWLVAAQYFADNFEPAV